MGNGLGSEIEIAVVKTHLENITKDICELKDGYKKMADLLGSLIVYEDRFKINDESHRVIWSKVNTTIDRVNEHERTAITVAKWEKRLNEVVVGISIVGAVQFVTFLIFVLRKF